jgi:LPS-assembly lipoprotein
MTPTGLPRRRLLALPVGVGLLAVQAGCGFALRGAADLPYKVYFVSAAPSSVLGGDLRRSIRANGATTTELRKDAQARLDILADLPESEISAFSTSGRPREYLLRLRVRWRLRDEAERDIIAESELIMRRTVTVLDAQGIVNAGQEVLLNRDMRNDAVQQILRRLSTVKPPA